MTYGVEKEFTSVVFSGIRIDEPVAVVTDFIVSIVCIYCYYKLGKLSSKTVVTQLYRYYFLFMGMGTFFGAIVGHAFLYALNPNFRLPGWILGMLSITLFERAAIFHAKPIIKPIFGKIFSIVNLTELITFICLASYFLIFKFVIIHAVYGMVGVVLLFEGFVYIKTKDKGSKIILQAILVATVAFFLDLFKFSFCKWFNYFDMGHCIIAISAYIFYIGIKKTAMYPNKYEQ